MALRAERDRPGLTEHTAFQSRKAEAAKSKATGSNETTLTEDEVREYKVVRFCRKLLERGVTARQPYDTWDTAWEMYIGDMWPRGMARWKAKITINKIRAYIHFMQAVMTDNKPRFSVDPLVPGSEEASKLLTKIADRDWDESDVQDKLSLSVLWGLIWGTGVMKCTYDPRADGGRGKHETFPVVPYRIWTNAEATGVEDAEFIIHIETRTLGWVYRNFPSKAKAIKAVRGSRVTSPNGNGNDRDYIFETQFPGAGAVDQSPAKLSGPGIITPIDITNTRDPAEAQPNSDDQDNIEVAEFWFRDESEEPYRYHVRNVDGTYKMADVLDDDGLPVPELASYEASTDPITGEAMQLAVMKAKQEPVMKWAMRPKYPNGRVAILGGPVLLRDIPNPFQIDGFPFAIWKDQDVGVFFGQGEPLQLKDLNIGVNRVAGQIYDNLNLTGNSSFVVDKNAGINLRTFRSRPALVIPADNVNGIKPLEVKSLPPQFFELAQFLKQSMGEVSGLSDAVMGGANPTNAAFATIDQLQESGSAILRMKVRNMEKMIKRMGKLRVQLIQQYDMGDRPIREQHASQDEDGVWSPIYENGDPESGNIIGVVPPAAQAEVRFTRYSNPELQGPIEFKIVPDSSLSTSPSGMWNRYMQLWDKKLIDLQGFHEKFEIDGWRGIVQRMQAMSAMGAAKKKPGPPPNPGRKPIAPKLPAPSSQMPSRLDLNATR